MDQNGTYCQLTLHCKEQSRQTYLYKKGHSISPEVGHSIDHSPNKKFRGRAVNFEATLHEYPAGIFCRCPQFCVCRPSSVMSVSQVVSGNNV